MAAFSSAGQVRRQPAPVNTSMRRARSDTCISSEIDIGRSSKPAPNIIPFTPGAGRCSPDDAYGPGALDQGPPRPAVPRLGDPFLAHRIARGALARNQTEITDQLAWGLEPAQVADLYQEGHRADQVHAPQRLQRLHGRRQRPTRNKPRRWRPRSAPASLGRVGWRAPAPARRSG